MGIDEDRDDDRDKDVLAPAVPGGCRIMTTAPLNRVIDCCPVSGTNPAASVHLVSENFRVAGS